MVKWIWGVNSDVNSDVNSNVNSDVNSDVIARCSDNCPMAIALLCMVQWALAVRMAVLDQLRLRSSKKWPGSGRTSQRRIAMVMAAHIRRPND